MKLEIKID